MLTKEQIEQLRTSFQDQLSTRAIETLPASYNPEKRSMRVIAASERPTPMIDWDRWMMVDEILLMDGMEMPSGRVQVPLLDSHNRWSVDSLLGTAREFETVGDKKEANVYFASTEKASSAETLAREGHLTDLSVGYRQLESFFIPEGEKQVIKGKEYAGPVKVTTKWQLKELSMVPIGADENAVTKSVRSNPNLLEQLHLAGLPKNAGEREILDFLRKTFETTPAASGEEAQIHTPQQRGATVMEPKQKTNEEVLMEERQRVSEIEKIAQQFVGRLEKIDELQREAVNKGWDVPLFKGNIVDRIGASDKPIFAPDSQLDLSSKETKQFSLLRYIQSRLPDSKVKAEFEQECSREIEKRIGKAARGLFIPWEVQNRDLGVRINSTRELEALRTLAIQANLVHAARALTSTTATGAAELVGTNLRPDLFVELLRSRSISGQVGVQILTGLVGNLSIPKQTGAATWEWTGENGTTTGSALTTGAISMSPKEGRAFQEYHRMLLLQSSPSIEMLVQNDLLAIALLGIDKAVFHGLGSSNQPKGIINESGIGSVDGVDLGWGGIVEFETDVSVGNADVARMWYVTNATIRGLLKTRTKVANYPEYLMTPTGEINGYPSAISNQIAAAHIFFGDFSPEILGYWGNLDLLINPFAKDKEGITRVNIFADVDCALRQAASISASSTVS